MVATPNKSEQLITYSMYSIILDTISIIKADIWQHVIFIIYLDTNDRSQACPEFLAIVEMAHTIKLKLTELYEKL